MSKLLRSILLASYIAITTTVAAQESFIPPTNPFPQLLHEQKKYALILAGDVDTRHETNIKLAYNTLQEAQFTADNIYILKENTPTPSKNICRASKINLEATLKEISTQLTPQDFLFIYVTGHGGTTSLEAKDAYIPLEDNEQLTINELEELLTPFEHIQTVKLFDQCFSGGFSEGLEATKHVNIAACNYSEESHSNTFPRTFFIGWSYCLADNNKDDKISVLEAFELATKLDTNTQIGAQHPQMSNKPLAKDIFLQTTF